MRNNLYQSLLVCFLGPLQLDSPLHQSKCAHPTLPLLYCCSGAKEKCKYYFRAINVFCWLRCCPFPLGSGCPEHRTGWEPGFPGRLCLQTTASAAVLRYCTWQNLSSVPLMAVPVSSRQIDVFLLNAENHTSSAWSKLVILGFFLTLRAVNLQKWFHHLGWDLNLSGRNQHVPIYSSGSRVSLVISISDLMWGFLGGEGFLATNYSCLIALHPLLQP